MGSFGLFFQDLDASLQNLTAQVERATSEKISCQEEVTHTNQTIELANRLVKGLEVKQGEVEEFVSVIGADLAESKLSICRRHAWRGAGNRIASVIWTRSCYVLAS